MRSEIQQEVDRQMVLFIVQRNIFCPITGEVLDIRTCKWFVDKDGDPAYVLSPTAYDAAVKAPGVVEALAEKGLFPRWTGETHQSAHDSSPAMMLSAEPFVLMNEDGYAWEDNPDDWVTI